jgi:hypothetical protein
MALRPGKPISIQQAANCAGALHKLGWIGGVTVP